MLAKVELPYRVINTAAGDLGSSAAQKFDCNMAPHPSLLHGGHLHLQLHHLPGATRLNVRERFEGENRTVATLNGTLATTRWLVALFENHQQADGSLYIPEALRPYLGGRDPDRSYRLSATALCAGFSGAQSSNLAY